MISPANRLNSVKEYYFSTKLKEVNTLKGEGKPILNIAIGSPDLAPPESVIKAIQNEVSHAHTHQYQSYIGIPELREAIQKFSKRHYNVNVNPNTEILPLMGSKEGIMHITMAFVNTGDHVLIPNPGYPTYSAVT
ncbi:MAG TPA: aminotransferase class I/II-fold pyridoxal phosphate-dependent enzyme, partial [Flavobacteriaceae bacterium]|nr:aminotransferase class I/II-fold pyridoxal phosphate-dependent enzyme [Flavobacteriaceae bacterium]